MTTNPLNDISKVYLEQIASVDEAAKPDYLDFDKDGNKKESMKKALRDKKSQKVEEAKKPNDGNLANNYPPYDKVTRGDVIAGATGKDQMGGKKKVAKESFSNWRQDLSEVMTDVEDKKKIKEKKVENKITINPKLVEAVEDIGGTLLEMVEIDEVDYIVESLYDELLDEGYKEDDIEEAIEYALTEAKVTFGHDTKQPESGASRLVRAVGRLARQKLSSKVREVKGAAKKAVVRGARAVASGASKLADKVEGGSEKKETTYRGAGVGRKEKVSSGSYTPPKAKTKKAAAPKAKAPAATAPKRKRKSKLDDLLADIRSEETQIDERTLTAPETMEKERIVKSMKKKAGDFEKRYPGRGKEVMYATATKMAKKMAEEIAPTTTPDPSLEKKSDMLDKTKLANLKMLQQKQQMLQRQKLQMQKTGKLPLEASYQPEGEVVEAHRPPFGWKSYGPTDDDKKPTVKIPPEGVMQGGWLKKEKPKKS